MKKIFLTALILTFSSISIWGADKFKQELQMIDEYLSVKDQIVVSASKWKQKLDEAPVAITVITSDDIKMSGVQSLAEVLRMAPGVYVQETSGGQQDVAIRGMINSPKENGAFAAFSRNILVMIDGRSYFNDIFGGTFWEFIPITVEDIDRIEVVRGPATSLFGANAVTGVINIITKNTSKTKGFSGVTNFGNENHQKHSLRYGNSFKNLTFRISGELTQKNAFDNLSYDHSKQIYEYRYSVLASAGTPNLDYLPPYKKSLDAYRISSFFNYDLEKSGELELQLGFSKGKFNSNGSSGDLFLMGYKNMENNVVRLSYQINNFKFTVSDIYGQLGTEYKKSAVYKEERDGITGDTIWAPDDYAGDQPQNGINWNSLDFELQNVFNFSDKDKLVAGINYRTTKARSDAQYFRATSDNEQNFTAAYFNNEYKILDNLKWILGARYDKYNKPDKSAFSPQSIIYYKPDDNQTLRFIYSQAIRAPFMADVMMDLQFSNGFTQDDKWAPLLKLSPNENINPMKIKSYEIGYSKLIDKKLSIDLNLYHYSTKDIIGYQMSASDSPAAVAEHLWKSTSAAGTLRSVNLDGTFKSNGAELGFNYLLDRHSKIWGNYSYQNSKINDLHSKASPEQLLSIGINKKLKSGWSFAVSANYVSGYTVSLTNVMDHTLYQTLTKAGGDYSLLTNRYTNNIYNSYITTGALAFSQLGGHTIDSAAAGFGLLSAFVNDTEASFLGFSQQNPALITPYRNELLGYYSDTDADKIIAGDTMNAGKAARAGFGAAFVTSSQNISTQSVSSTIFYNIRIAKKIFNDNGEFAVTASLRPDRREYPFGEKTGDKYMASLSYKF